MEWVETTGDTVDAAKERALDRLGVHDDEAEFEVLTEAKVGLFGRVKEEARVRARVRPSVPRAKDDRRRRRARGKGGNGGARSGGRGSRSRSDANGRAGADSKGAARSNSGRDSGVRGRGDGRRGSVAGSRGRGGGNGRGSGDRDRDGARDSGTEDEKRKEPMVDEGGGPTLEEQASLAERFVQGIAEGFGTSLTFRRHDLEDDVMRIEAQGEDIGLLIGRRGRTAQSIDELVRTVLQRAGGTTREGKIRVDIGGVRDRRRDALRRLSLELAGKVRDSGEAVALEAMAGADRKVVHDVINEFDDVASRSEGEDPHRRVVIVPSGD